ncbi:hypothetical protein [Pseudomonas sp.]|uniref:hypothetical protein n=1 Tax=Pseudomonas sp. TaxID=306 RepID=UPI000FB24624
MLADNTGYKAFDDIDSASKNFLWSTLHSAEMAKGLVETLINGVAAFEYPPHARSAIILPSKNYLVNYPADFNCTCTAGTIKRICHGNGVLPRLRQADT